MRPSIHDSMSDSPTSVTATRVAATDAATRQHPPSPVDPGGPPRRDRSTRGPGAVRRLLTDRDLDWRTRLVHLQGWRGAEAVQAKEAWWLLAPAPLLCAVGAVAGGLLGSSTLLLLLAVSAAIGAIAPHHPIEVVANLHARRRGRVPKPPSPAGRRTGCAMGSVVLPVAAVLMAAGHTAAGAAVAIGFGGVAAFVGLTGICVPSIILTTWRGTEACTATDPITRRSHTV